MKPREKKLDKVFRYLHLYNKIYLMFITSNSDKIQSMDICFLIGLHYNRLIQFEITLFVYGITQMRKKYLPLLQDK